MGYRGRIFAVAVVCLLNILRYFYYHQYIGIPFNKHFFVLTGIFLSIAWIGGRQYDLARYYSEKDPLTDIYNRRMVDKVFYKLAKNCKTKDQKLGVIIIDLDNFKNINDQYGHHKGDELLRFVADSIKKTSRKNDVIVRWGGDEFLHIIPSVQKDFEFDYIKKLNKKLQQNAIFPIDASIGIAIYPDEGENFEALVQQADTAMYEMKAYSNTDEVPVV